jgi:hypothetical protein
MQEPGPKVTAWGNGGHARMRASPTVPMKSDAGRARPRPPWWMFLLAASFLGYLVLLVYCDIWRPESPGFVKDSTADAMIVRQVAPLSPADRAGLRPGDRIVSWDGRPTRDLEWMFIDATLEIGRPLPLVIERGAQRLVVPLTLGRMPSNDWLSQGGWLLLTVRAVQLVSLVLGFVIALKRPFDPMSRLGAWLLATVGVFCVVLPSRIGVVWRDLPVVPAAFFWLPYLSSLAIAAMVATFVAMFPRKMPRATRGWVFAWMPMALALIRPASYTIRMVYRPETVRAGSFGGTILSATSLAYLVWGLTMLVVNYRQLTDITERRRVRVVVMGLLVGCLLGAPVIPLYWLTTGDDLDRTLFNSPLSAVPTLLMLAIPLSFTYAILRHRLFDVSVMIRQGVRYALARRVVGSVIPLLALGLVADLALMHRDDAVVAVFQAHVWVYVVLAGLAMFAHARRQRWIDAIDRRFFRERYDAQRVLRRVAHELRDAGSIERAAPVVVAQLESSLHAEFAALLVRRAGEREYTVIAAAPPEQGPPPIPTGAKVIALLGVLGRPLEMALPGLEWLAQTLPAAEVDFIRNARIEMLVPAGATSDRSSAILALGPKRSEEPYTADDHDLLVAIADSLALLLDRQPGEAGTRDTFEECPDCGACYDSGTGQCQSEGSRLLVATAPRVLAGRYRIERRIGHGGMGTVYTALDMSLNRRVAAKLIREEFASVPDASERFQTEARIAAAFTHPNVVTVHDYGVAGAHAYLVMELLDGRTLRSALKDEQRFAPARAVAILRDVAAAVDAAHRRQLVHRDLKPENICLVASDDGETAKVLDFGIAKLMVAADSVLPSMHNTGGALVGTPLYMAPEQLRGEDPHASWDLWALAVIAFELLTGSHPFEAVLLNAPASSGPNGLAGTPLRESSHQVFASALGVDPAGRPPSGRAFVADLERSLL